MTPSAETKTDALDRIELWCLAIALVAALGVLAIGLVAWWTL